MYVSFLLNVTNKMCAVVSKNRKSTLRNNKSNVGKIIKKLNTENKSLFGGLLETRREKRKRERELPSELVPDESKKSSEAYWYNRVSKTDSRTSPKKLPNYELKIQKSNETNHIFDIKRNVCDNSFDIENLEDNNVTSLENLAGSHSNVGKNVTKIGVLELPEIIIRNITSFPLQNKDSKIFTQNRQVPLQFPEQKDNYLSFPSVTKILSTTMSDYSRAALNRWQQRMISELGEEGFLTYKEGLLEKGIRFHSVIYNFLSGTLESELNLNGVEGCWDSVNDIITAVTDVRFLESDVVHSDLLYRGVIDCVASYKGKKVLIEWKRSTKQKDDIGKTYDAPVQLSAYVGAMNYDDRYDTQVQGGLIVVAYTDGCPARIFRMTMTDCQKYWRIWLYRLQKYWFQKRNEDKLHEIH